MKVVGHKCLLLSVVAFCCGLSCASAQETNSPTSNATAFGSQTSLPPVDTTNQQAPNDRSSNQTSDQMPQFETSIQQAANAGLVPTLSGESNSQVANGFVPTFPGPTSLGAQAASAASSSQKFLTVYATQTIAYSDNPGQVFDGRTAVLSQASYLNRPDFYEVSSGGILLSKQLGLQNFFASANIGLTNYFHDKNFDSTRYSFSIGDNYAVGDLCTGVLVANQSQSEVPIELSVSSLSAQTSQNSSVEVSTRCKVSGHLYTTSDFRVNSTSFTSSISSANNSMQTFGSGGLEYAVPQFVTMGLLASIQETNFTNRDAFGLGLSNQTSQLSFNGYVNKPLSRKLNVSLSGGIADLATGAPTFSGSIEPIYTATASYAYSPKTSFNFNYAHSVGSPQSIIANFQQIETISLGINYRLTPKIGINTVVARSSTSASPVGGVLNSAATGLSQNTQSITEQVSASYSFAHNASAFLSLQHIDRTEGSLGAAKVNIVSLAVNYRR